MEQLNQSDATSHDIVAENMDKLKAIFPEAFTEGKVDFDVLKETLGEYRETREERYNFSWAGKSKARRLAQTPTTGTLRPCPEESVDWDKTENLFIEGDNLEVLKLLQKSYQGQVKMIYIDPPYNTGGDFVYPDKYADNLKGYLEYTNQVDAEGNKQSTNTEASGRYHSNWLNMMMPRLHLAKNLLKKDGVIFISIDDNEVQNLRKLCDETFGEENFIASLIWEKTRKNDAHFFSVGHEYILVYAKDEGFLRENEIKFREPKPGAEEIYNEFIRLRDFHGNDLQKIEAALRKFYSALPKSHPAKKHTRYNRVDQRGVWRDDNMSWPGGGGPDYDVVHPKTGKPCKVPPGGWRFSTPEKMKKMIDEGVVEFREDHTEPPIRKTYLVRGDLGSSEEAESSQVMGTYFYRSALQASTALQEIFDSKLFENPKDHEILGRLCKYVSTSKEDTFLDFFSGSCSTAQGILELNKEDGGNRKFVMVQIPEPCKVPSEAFKAGYKTIADIGKERIRRVASKIKEAHPDYDGDLGFKVFKLDSSNIEAWDSNIENLEDSVLKAANVLKEDRSELDIVYELFLKYGLDLSYPVNTHEVAGKQVYEVGAGSLFICLEDGITTDFVEGLIELYESFDDEAAPRVVFKDSGFATDAAKKDAESTLKDAGILDVKCL